MLDSKNLLNAGHNMRTLTKRWRLALAAIGLTVVMALLTDCSRKTSGTPDAKSQSTAGAGHGGWALHVMNQPGNVFQVEYSEIRDLGNSVLGIGRARVRGKTSRVPIESPFCALVDAGEDGKAIRLRTYLDRNEALEAAGLSE